VDNFLSNKNARHQIQQDVGRIAGGAKRDLSWRMRSDQRTPPKKRQ